MGRAFQGIYRNGLFSPCTSYAPLAEYYPDAKVVLTVRDPEKWFASAQSTIFGKEWIEFLPGTEAGAYMKATINDYFDGRMHDHDHLIRRFNEHVADVRDTIDPEAVQGIIRTIMERGFQAALGYKG